MKTEYQGDKDIIITGKRLTYAALPGFVEVCNFVNEHSIKQENIQQIMLSDTGFTVIYYWH